MVSISKLNVKYCVHNPLSLPASGISTVEKVFWATVLVEVSVVLSDKRNKYIIHKNMMTLP